MSFPFLSILNSLQSSLTIYIMPSSSACYVTSQHHPPTPPAPTPCIITELGRVKKELSEIILINWQCSNIMQYLNNEYGKYLEDACLDLKIRKHVYNCSRIFTAAYHILYMWVWVHVHCTEYTYMGESTGWEETGTAEMSSWDQANRRKNLGLVWRNRKKISQIIKDYFHLPCFLLIILCMEASDNFPDGALNSLNNIFFPWSRISFVVLSGV